MAKNNNVTVASYLRAIIVDALQEEQNIGISSLKVEVQEEGEDFAAFWKRFGIPSDHLSLADIWEQEERARKAKEARMLEDAHSDAKAVWALADYYLSVDVQETAERWNMKETLIEIWRNAFIEGWRAAHRK